MGAYCIYLVLGSSKTELWWRRVVCFLPNTEYAQLTARLMDKSGADKAQARPQTVNLTMPELIGSTINEGNVQKALILT